MSQRGNSCQLETHDETHEENEQEDDETASKGSNESKKSYNERVLNTKYENDKSETSEMTMKQILRRKSIAPALHSTLTE